MVKIVLVVVVDQGDNVAAEILKFVHIVLCLVKMFTMVFSGNK